jgi:glycosyltransferase involved in cell wall biosynthesis
LILIPAFNEQTSLASLLPEVARECPGLDVLVVDDGSTDLTAAVARAQGARVLALPHNLGVGGAVQAGFLYAFEAGYPGVARLDADGQHPPAALAALRARLAQGDVDMVVASRFLSQGEAGYQGTALRQIGIGLLARALSSICRQPVTDPTSGFFLLNRRLLHFFALRYPTDYPEPEALALLRRQGYSFAEVGATFRERRAGKSTIGGWGAIYYMVKVGLALLVDRARSVDPRLERARLPEF